MEIFLISVGVMCGISFILAVLMVVAESTIGNYGEVSVTINDDKQLTIQGGRTLLNTLKNEKVFIPSACGGRGSCGLCKCKVTEGAGDYLPTEISWMSKEEQAQNIRLSCQLKVKNDMRIEIDPELLYVKEFKGVVKDIVNLTHDIKQVTISLREPTEITYKAGQFIQLETPEYDLTDEPVYRAYSMSSPPSSRNEVEVEVRLVPDGICTTYVHNHLKTGDTITFNGPYGDFHMSDTGKPIIGIAGGSGMAPLKAIILDMIDKGITDRPFQYFFGAKSKRDLFLLDEMKAIEKDMPNFKFIAALSEPEPGDHWDGETGLITQVVDRYIDDASGMEAYLCGSPFMIDACIKVLKDKGMPEASVFYDKFA